MFYMRLLSAYEKISACPSLQDTKKERWKTLVLVILTVWGISNGKKTILLDSSLQWCFQITCTGKQVYFVCFDYVQYIYHKYMQQTYTRPKKAPSFESQLVFS